MVRVNRVQFLFLVLLIEAVLLFLLAPTGHSVWFSWLCMIQFLFSTVVYIVVQQKNNYFDFDVIFLLTFFFIMFFFPVFMYGTDLEKLFFAFQYDYNHDVISRATALSLLGAQAYMFGGIMVNKEKIKLKTVKAQTIIPNGILTIEVLACFALFFVAVGPELFTHKYDGQVGGEGASAAVSYILVLLCALFISAMTIEFHNWSIDKQYKKNVLLFFAMVVFMVVFLIVGSRTMPLQYGLLILGIFSLKVRSINLKWMLIVVTSGIVVMGAFGLMRTQDEQGNDDLKEAAGPIVFVQDLVLNNRNTFMAIDMVDKDGIDFGVGMTTTLLGVFPFANSMVLNTTPLTELDMSSGLRITAKSLGTTRDFSVGFGTNIVADAYLSFGMIGVVFLLFA
ncbi:MAG: O-antigen polysaccharide polymerase Wzy, partial [Mucinivorans sp.]